MDQEPLMRVDRWDVRRDGRFGETALMHKVRALGYEPVTRLYPAGAIIALPSDGRPRLQAVAAGLVKITINSEAAILSAGDLLFLPPDTTPRVEILGPSNAICFEA